MSSPDLLPLGEIEFRYARCRRLLRTLVPDAGGMLVTSRLGIYYLTGTLGWGLVWLPIEGEPVLLLRKGVERAQLESPLHHILPFKSYKEIASLCAGCGSPLSSAIAVDKNGFNWSMAEMLQSRMEGVRFTSCDTVLAQARAVKSEWELEKLRRCGALHAKVLDEMLPERIHPGMSEFDVARTYVEAVFACGGSGMLRMNAPGEENFFGYASADTSGIYPTYYNGPLGCKGMCPAIPFMGNAERLWQKRALLSIDMGFNVEGYNTDRTQVYWSGAADTIPGPIRRAHAVCVEIFEQTAAALKPGAVPAEIWAEACAVAQREGQMDGFMGLGRDKVPFLGHGIGLTVDETPVFAKGFTAPLEQGMVVAIEPKIGIPGSGMVGLEHTLEITASGARPLTGTSKQVILIG